MCGLRVCQLLVCGLRVCQVQLGGRIGIFSSFILCVDGNSFLDFFSVNIQRCEIPSSELGVKGINVPFLMGHFGFVVTING